MASALGSGGAPATSAPLGPAHSHIVRMLTRLRTITTHQDEAIQWEWYERRGPERFSARSSAFRTAARAGRLEALLRARELAWTAHDRRCIDALGDAAIALSVRDLIGEDFTQASYDALVWPVASVLGLLHESDALPAQAGSEAGHSSE